MIKLRFIFLFIIIFTTKNTYAAIRIVSLAPNLTEIVYALKQEKNLVGNTRQCDYPNEAKNIPKIGDYINPNIEKIIALKPTVVLATEGNPYTVIETLKKFGISIVTVNPRTLKDIPSMIQTVAEQIDAQGEGQTLSEKINAGIEKYSKSKKRHQTFLITLSAEPIYSVGLKTWMSDLFVMGGFQNIIKSDLISYPVVSKEFLMKHKPDVIFAVHKKIGDVENIYRKELSSIYGKDQFKLLFLKQDIFVRPGPRILEAIAEIENIPR